VCLSLGNAVAAFSLNVYLKDDFQDLAAVLFGSVSPHVRIGIDEKGEVPAQ
jgi:hypothetical protein